MRDKKISLCYYFYEKCLNTIEGIKFSQSKINIMACLIHGKDAKSIGQLLGIEAKTIHNNISEINQKLNCGSKQGIITLIERSSHNKILREYYDILLLEKLFNQLLKDIHFHIKKEQFFYLIFYEAENEEGVFLIKLLNKHLSLLGIKAKTSRKKFPQHFKNAQNQASSKALYVLSKKALLDHLSKYKETHPKNLQLFQKIEQSYDANLFVFICNSAESSANLDIPSLDHICIGVHKNYYLSFLELLEELLPTHDLDHFKRKFFNQNRLNISAPTDFNGVTQPTSRHSWFDFLLTFLPKVKKWLVLGSLAFLATVPILILVFSYNGNFNFGKVQPAIRSDLLIPIESKLIKRLDIIAKIEKNLKGEGIKAVALVGIGGSGKTTLARQYARHLKSSVAWEINAETQEALLRSFENLAYALATTGDDKKIVREIQDLKEDIKKQEQIILFVKERLRQHPGWLLIYDNVESFKDIQKYYPSDVKSWGDGKVILTTRNSTIQNNTPINNILPIGELNSYQKFILFTQIMHQGNQREESKINQRETEKFLKEIPSFPLDVSIAAYYIQGTNVSYNTYLESLKKNEKGISVLQEGILKDGEYNKSRYAIITLSLQKLIENYPECIDLLFFISLLDSQNIPKELLDSYKNTLITDNLVLALKRYSLIADGINLSGSEPTFSIHRSTQKIVHDYLITHLPQVKIDKFISSIARTLERYAHKICEVENVQNIKLLVGHCERFLAHQCILKGEDIILVGKELGWIYFYLGSYPKAKLLLERCEGILLKNSKPLSPLLLTEIKQFLGVVYNELNYYEKARQYLNESLALYKIYRGEKNIEVAHNLQHLASVDLYQGKYQNAKQSLEEAYRILIQHYPNNYIDIGRVTVRLGNASRELGNYKEALRKLREALDLYKKYLNEHHYRYGQTLVRLGQVYKDIGKFKEAKNLIEQGLVIYRTHFPEKSDKVAWVLVQLGQVERKLGHYEEAKHLFEKSLNTYKELSQMYSTKPSWPLTYLGKLFMDMGKYITAINLLEESLIGFEKNYGKGHLKTAHVIGDLGKVYYLQGNLHKSEELLRTSLKICDLNKHPQAYVYLESLADLYLRKSMLANKKKDKSTEQEFKKISLTYLSQAYNILSIHFPEDSPHLERIKRKIKEAS